MFPFMWYIQNKQIHRDRKHNRASKGMGGQNREWLLNGYELFMERLKSFETSESWGLHIVSTRNTTESYTLKWL